MVFFLMAALPRPLKESHPQSALRETERKTLVHILVIHHWPQEDPTVEQTVAEALGMLVFETRQRMVGGGPVVIAKFADRQQAETLEARLMKEGVPTLLVDTETLRARAEPLWVRTFRLDETALDLETAGGENVKLPYAKIRLMLSATTVVGQSESTSTITKRKFSLGKTLLAGGIPLTKKVKQQQTLRSEERDEVLCLHALNHPPIFFCRGTLNYAGLGVAIQLSRELNFTHLKNELTRYAPQALRDNRLLNRANQVRLLGTSLDPDSHLDLAFEILVRTLL